MKPNQTLLLLFALFTTAWLAMAGCQEAAQIEAPVAADDALTVKSRTFRFVYGATLTEIEPDSAVRVWLPMATSNHDQEVDLESVTVPGEFQKTKDAKFGNDTIYFEAKANAEGEVPLKVTYRVTRRELTERNREAVAETEVWLQPSSKVPNDEQLRKAVIKDADTEGVPFDVAKQLYLGVGEKMKYDKPADNPGWGQGDAKFACESCFGNCTDFHSLFMSAALNLEIPCRFEIGFPIPEAKGQGEVGGYHCWAKFQSEGTWVPVDISEADKHPELRDYYFGNLTENRITFSIGRDLKLQPAPAAESVNYLAYPYAEVDGKPHKKFRKEFSYEDVE